MAVIKFDQSVSGLLTAKATTAAKTAEIETAVERIAEAARRAARREASAVLGFTEAETAAKQAREVADAALETWLSELADRAWTGEFGCRVIYVTDSYRLVEVIGAAALTPAGFPWPEEQREVAAYYGLRQHKVNPFRLQGSRDREVVKIHSRREEYSDRLEFASEQEWAEKSLLFEVDPALVRTNETEMAALRAYLLTGAPDRSDGLALLTLWREFFPSEDLLDLLEPGTEWHAGGGDSYERFLFRLPTGPGGRS